jgi:hypothetical protein
VITWNTGIVLYKHNGMGHLKIAQGFYFLNNHNYKLIQEKINCIYKPYHSCLEYLDSRQQTKEQ